MSDISGSLTNGIVEVYGYVNTASFTTVRSPEHIPANIEAIFIEGNKCLSIQCFNAAGTMFRLCVDMATLALLPEPLTPGLPQPKYKQRRDLGLRVEWLFNNELLPKALQTLADCIREDGNDGAHRGTLTEADAEDLRDFTVSLLERLYTEHERIHLAEERRAERRKSK